MQLRAWRMKIVRFPIFLLCVTVSSVTRITGTSTLLESDAPRTRVRPATMVKRAPVAGSARVYDISGRAGSQLGPSLELGHRATAAEKRAKRKADTAARETELLDAFELPTVSSRVKQTRDGAFIFASGVYPPQIQVYDTSETSMKFKRHVDSEIVDFQVLDDDWRKFALLTADRYVDLQSPFGSHFRTRVPRAARDLCLHRGTADLYVVGAGRDAWRLNLAQGRFLAPLRTARPSISVVGLSPLNRLLAFGGDDGVVEVWDSRVAGRSGAVAAGMADSGAHARAQFPRYVRESPRVSAVRFDECDGVTMAVGTSSGHALLYDLRMPTPLFCRDQGFGLPVHTLRFLHGGVHVLSSDAKSIKVWRREDSATTVTIEPDVDVNHVCVLGRSGVLCAAVEAPRVRSYYIPSLGHAPRWCAFLDMFTEELEEEAGVAGTASGSAAARSAEDGELEEVYENFKFVSREDLDGVGLGHLIGTDMLKPYMHGFFVHARLYRRAVEASEPFAYEKYKQERAREKMEKMRESRIGKVRSGKKVKVNKKVAERLESKRGKGRKGSLGASIMEDPRFAAMFEKEEFAVDEQAERFQQLNPSGTGEKSGRSQDDSDEEYLEQFTLVDEDGDAKKREPSDGSDGGDGSEDLETDESAEDDEQGSIRKPRTSKREKRRGTRMFEIGNGAEVLSGKGLGNGSKGVAASKVVRSSVALGDRVDAKRKQ